jgi:hypothetical protein
MPSFLLVVGPQATHPGSWKVRLDVEETSAPLGDLSGGSPSKNCHDSQDFLTGDKRWVAGKGEKASWKNRKLITKRTTCCDSVESMHPGLHCSAHLHPDVACAAQARAVF